MTVFRSKSDYIEILETTKSERHCIVAGPSLHYKGIIGLTLGSYQV